MRIKKTFIFIFVLLAVAGAVFFIMGKNKKAEKQVVKEITPFIGSIKTYISSTGTVLPKNRLEIKPPVNGRIESILVKEGQTVKIGEILATMSSTDRAALLDAARGKGEKDFAYWQETYKAIPLPAPIDGEVIVATTQPGQTVTSADAVVVLSDRLIIRAQVDETDIGKITLDQNALITFDAYPDAKIKAKVEHIYYESKTVNNVTIYEVDLKPEELPQFCRSGMNATVDFVELEKENILLIPTEAVVKEKGESFVLLKQNGDKEFVKARVALGVSDDKNIEVLSGITDKDKIVLKSKKYSLPKNSSGKNPFMPSRR